MSRWRRPITSLRLPLLLPLLLGLASSCRGGAGSRPSFAGDSGTSTSPSWTDAFPALDGGGAGFALRFDGAKDYATAGDGGFPAADSAQSIELWVNYPAATATADFLVMRLDHSSGVQIGIHDGALAVWRTYVDRVLVSAPTLPAVSTWHHVAYTYDGTTETLYVDGVVADTETNAGDTRTPTSVWLGTFDGSSELYKGELDEARVWTVVRSAAEVVADMRHSPPGPVAGLVAYWTFDDTVSGGRALDASGSGNDVTLGDGIAERMPTRVPSDAPVSDP
jgi:hypothetical protein